MIKNVFIILVIMVGLVLIGAVVLSVNTKIVEDFEDGRRVEKVIVFSKLTAVRSYDKAGQLDGVTRVFYPGGQIRGEWQFRENVKHGQAFLYDPEGNLQYEDYYDSGTKVSRRKFDAAGTLLAEEQYDN